MNFNFQDNGQYKSDEINNKEDSKDQFNKNIITSNILGQKIDEQSCQQETDTKIRSNSWWG